MKKCPNCLADSSDEVKFCGHCGASLTGVSAVPHELQMRDETSVRLGVAYPFRAWMADRPWGIRWVRWFLFFGLFPLLCYTFFNEIRALNNTVGAFKQVAWFIAGYFGLFWAFVLRLCISPEKTQKFLATKVIAFTAIVGIILVLLLQYWGFFRDIYDALDHSQDVGTRIFGYVFGVGFLEEAIKALPVFWFVFRKHRSLSPATFAYFGAMSGLAFGVAEAVDYSLRYAIENAAGKMNYSVYVVATEMRFVTLPLLHAAWSGIACYFMGLAALKPRAEWRLIGLGVGTVMLLHGFYDTFGGWVGFLLAGFSLLLFICYLRTKPEVWNDLEKEEHAAKPSPQMQS